MKCRVLVAPNQIHKLIENSSIKSKFESLENLMLRIIHNNQANSDGRLAINSINIPSITTPTNNAQLNMLNSNIPSSMNIDIPHAVKASANLNRNRILMNFSYNFFLHTNF